MIENTKQAIANIGNARSTVFTNVRPGKDSVKMKNTIGNAKRSIPMIDHLILLLSNMWTAINAIKNRDTSNVINLLFTETSSLLRIAWRAKLPAATTAAKI